ncbi:MAG: hypothetical protein ACRD4U_06230 [Candidatus Acidiferrales bacterium]
MADYVTELAQATGFAPCPKQGPYGDKEGCVVGARDGFVFAVGRDTSENQHGIAILARFKSTETHENVKAAVQAHPAVQAAKGDAKLKESGADFVRWKWNYSLRRPKAEAVAELVRALAEALKQATPGFDGKCESCQRASAPEILLLNGVPGYYCEACQQQMHHDLDKATLEYEALPTDTMKGLTYGLGAMLAGAAAWGLVAYFLKYIFLWGAILIGYLIAKAVQVGMGKIERTGQVLVVVLTILSVLLGDTLFYCLIIMEQEQIPFSLDLLLGVILNLVTIESESEGGIGSVLFALIGAGYALYAMRKPKFKAHFERLGQPAG